MAASYSIPPRLNFVFGAVAGLPGALLWRAPWRPDASLAEWLVPLALAVGFAFGMRAARVVGIALVALSAWVLWWNAQISDVDAPELRRGTAGAILLCTSAAALFGAVAVARSRTRNRFEGPRHNPTSHRSTHCWESRCPTSRHMLNSGR